jgi:hypothetical protein
MTTTDLALAAVRGFAATLGRARGPDRICVRLHGADGMARLCAVEAAIVQIWPGAPARELVWLTRTAAAETLCLQAFADGALLAEATYDLGMADA